MWDFAVEKAGRLLIDALYILQRDAIRSLILKATGSPLYAGLLSLLLIALAHYGANFLRNRLFPHSRAAPQAHLGAHPHILKTSVIFTLLLAISGSRHAFRNGLAKDTQNLLTPRSHAPSWFHPSNDLQINFQKRFHLVPKFSAVGAQCKMSVQGCVRNLLGAAHNRSLSR